MKTAGSRPPHDTLQAALRSAFPLDARRLAVLCALVLAWTIECTFSALKSRGLGLEETHMVKAARIERLFGLLTLALVWMVRVGSWRAQTRPIPVKKHGRKAVGVAQ